MSDPIVLVEWLDAALDHGDFPRKQAEQFRGITVRTVGHLLYEGADGATLAVEHFLEEDTFRSLRFIPRVNIIFVTRLEADGNGPERTSS